MDKLVDRLRGVADRLGSLNSRFGDPRYVQVVMVPPSGAPVLVVPDPKVTEADPRTVEQYLGSVVGIASDVLVVDGISRSHTQDFVSKAQYLLNATQRSDGTWTGKKCEVISVDTSSMLGYKVIVQRFRSR